MPPNRVKNKAQAKEVVDKMIAKDGEDLFAATNRSTLAAVMEKLGGSDGLAEHIVGVLNNEGASSVAKQRAAAAVIGLMNQVQSQEGKPIDLNLATEEDLEAMMQAKLEALGEYVAAKLA